MPDAFNTTIIYFHCTPRSMVHIHAQHLCQPPTITRDETRDGGNAIDCGAAYPRRGDELGRTQGKSMEHSLTGSPEREEMI